MGVYILCFMGGTPVGAPIVGWVAELFGPRWGMLGGGLISLSAAIGLGAYLSRRHRVGLSDLRHRLEPSRA
jgi:hypothetical protein